MKNQDDLKANKAEEKQDPSQRPTLRLVDADELASLGGKPLPKKRNESGLVNLMEKFSVDLENEIERIIRL